MRQFVIATTLVLGIFASLGGTATRTHAATAVDRSLMPANTMSSVMNLSRAGNLLPLQTPASESRSLQKAVKVAKRVKRRGRRGRRGYRKRRKGGGIPKGVAIGLGIAILGIMAEEAAQSGGYGGDYGYDNGYENAMRACARRFRSFDWDSGTYVTYGGSVRLCPYLRPYW